MAKITLFNPEQTPTVFSQDGRTVGGVERVEVETLDAVGQAAVDSGLLVREEKKTAKPDSSQRVDQKSTGAPRAEKQA